ncbi:methyl-accepting chemotaxis protein [Thiomicrospira sp. WB1]|uniref:HAMP domain-containing methyl-accepting chemotaxis protein n=1 Tax=Thiomicrospira sp. WB1 TaxID=1685380 RepID=UPI0007493DC5|nr:methyl-accepting chemotaxis protein [Thiomicrospira sp. WB1]KUJ71410.1 chemotaxis protein [Thiomicrospira sp. WB1]
MSVKQRILTLTVILLAFSVLAIAAGLINMKNNNQTFNALYNDRIVPLEDLKNIADAYAVNIVDTNHKLRNGNIDWAQAEQNIESASKQIHALWDGYMQTKLTPKEAALAEKAQALMKTADDNVAQLLTLVQQRDMNAITEFSIEQLYPAIDPISDTISELVALQLREAEKMQQAQMTTYDNTLTMAIVVALLVFLAVLWLARQTLLAITRPLNELVGVSKAVVQEGDFSKRVQISREDEVGQAAQAFNHLLEKTADAIQDANHVVDAIAQSDFDQRITREYQGDLNRLKLGINNSAESVSFMMSELERIMTALANGKLDAKMDEQVPANFRNKVEGALAITNDVVEDIIAVMDKIDDGQFSERVTADAKGQLASLKRAINSSMDDLNEAIKEVTSVVVDQSNGNLTSRIQGQYKGDLNTLKTSVNHTSEKLVDVIQKAINATQVVSGASAEVSQGSQDLSQRVQEQAASVEETSATMEQMNSAVQNNANHAKDATRVAHEVQEKTTEGTRVMQKTVDAMSAIQESSHKISDIVTLIDSIAFQTNLLALNAAVEAARAGEHGRGFAVVAGEVRALAQKSADAAKEITGLINESVARIDEGTKLASESGEMLDTIDKSVDDVANMIEQISAASNEQMTGIEQVHKAISQIDEVTQQNAALVEETSAAAESMSEQAEILDKDMSFFNTGQPKASAQSQSAPKVAKAPQKQTPAKPAKPAALPQASAKDTASAKDGDKAEKPKPAPEQSSADDEWAEF